MDIIYLKIKIKRSDTFTDEIREEGLFFSNIASAISIDRDAIEEIDESNYKMIIKQMQKKFKKYDKSRSNKKSFRG